MSTGCKRRPTPTDSTPRARRRAPSSGATSNVPETTSSPVVMFAVALFFAGMGTKLSGRTTRRAMLVVGCVVFAGAAAWVATFPVAPL